MDGLVTRPNQAQVASAAWERTFDEKFHRDCRVDGCTSTVHAQGLCRTHYRRVQRRGTVDLPGRTARLTAAQREEIRRRLNTFESPLALAREFDVAVETIKRAAKKTPVPGSHPGTGEDHSAGLLAESVPAS